MKRVLLTLVVVALPHSLRAAPCRGVLQLKLGDPAHQGAVFSDQFFKDSGRYLLTSFGASVMPSQDPDELNFDCEKLSPQIYSVLSRVRDPQTSEVDVVLLRELAGPQYLEQRNLRHEMDLPDRLEDFAKLTNFKSWPHTVIALSRVKNLTRVIYDSPPEFPVEISVAQTHNTQTGDLNAAVMETEVIFKRKGDDSNWDFYSYTPQGKIALHSAFRGRDLPVPTVCMGCHYSRSDRAFVPMMRQKAMPYAR